MVQRQAQEEVRARKETSARMKTIKQYARVRISARAWKSQEDVKIIDVQYIDGYVENKQIQWTMKIHFRYKAMDSWEQQVARLLGPTLCTIVTLGHSWAPTGPAQREAKLFRKESRFHGQSVNVPLNPQPNSNNTLASQEAT